MVIGLEPLDFVQIVNRQFHFVQAPYQAFAPKSIQLEAADAARR